MNVVFLGLGGNIGNRMENLVNAREALSKKCGTIVKVSGVYETEAWGSNSKNNYLNQVVKMETSLTVQELLERILSVESELGRVRTEKQNSDRTMDIDILFYNSEIINLDHLHIPHPRLHLRKFVLIPLCDIEADYIHPLLKKTLIELLKNCEDKLKVSAVGSV
ncbi:2-amino-4-hydroxy-6-hydroxymethyldihydropteridine diphosphokinase [Sphingobacteriaceae bacterium]|nr:2-amino-4-hydroxy-6-hydroxymethyldihydropteridine diphosphokinase [Sphingobacteriaceae bacterium]